MKRCPECRRDYYDDTLLYCLDDGNALLEGPRNADTPVRPSLDEPVTAILSEPGAVATGFSAGESPTRAQIHTTDQTAIFHHGAEAEPRKPLSDSSERQSLSAHWAAKPHEKFDGRNRLFLLSGIAVLVLVAGFFGYRYFAPTSSKQIESIAVMPFQNVGGSTDTEYLSDGISEALINSLTELQQLKVIARSTAFRYKGKDVDPQTVGRELNVGAVLMGRVRQVGGSLNVQVDLVDASTGAQLWGREYENKVADVVNVKQAIAREVTEKLRLKLSGEQEQKLTKRDPENAEAYQSYLRGRYYWNKRTADGLKRAEEEFQQAIDRDPGYARAHAALAETYAIFPSYSVGAPVESYSKTEAAARRALEIDPTLPEAHVALAGAMLNLYWNLHESNRAYERALELNPNYATAHHWYGEINLLIMGRSDAAIAHLKKAQELDPLSLIINADLGEVYINSRQYDNAIDQLKKTIAMEPNFHVSRMNLGIAYTFKGSYEQAVSELQKARQLSDDPRVLARLGYVYSVMGRRAEALEILDVLRENSKRQYISPFRFALVYVGLGDKDKAFAELEKSYQDRSPECEHLTYEPALDSIRSDPRFVDLVKRVGLTS